MTEMGMDEAAADAAMAGLRQLAIERASGYEVGSNRLIEAALDALLSGVDSPSLVLLAGLRRREEPEAPELFTKVIDELDLAPGLPADRDERLWAMARWWAGLIVAGKLDALTGADLIWMRVSMELGYPDQLRAITNGAINADDWNEGWTIPLEQIKSDIVQGARGFLAEARPID